MLGRHLNEELHDGELDPVHESHRDTELTLSSITLLALFLGLVLLCGACFGIGYTVGRHSAAPVVAGGTTPSGNSPVVVEAGTAASPAQPKPSASTQTITPQPATEAPVSAPTPSESVATPPPPAPAPAPVTTHPAPTSVPAPAKPAAKTAASSKAIPDISSSSALMVQIASVSHQEDADVLVEALRKHGYNASVHHDLFGDDLLHVQIGPFQDRASAYAMRQKLLNDGYNAIVRP